MVRFWKLNDLPRSIDTSPTDEDAQNPDPPLDRQIRIGAGIQYDWNKDVTVGAAYEYLDGGETEIDQDGGPFKGEYATKAIHFFAVNLIWKFKSTIGLVNAIYNFLILGIAAINRSCQILIYIVCQPNFTLP